MEERMSSKNKYGYGRMSESTAREVVLKAIYYGSKSFFKPGVGEVRRNNNFVCILTP